VARSPGRGAAAGGLTRAHPDGSQRPIGILLQPGQQLLDQRLGVAPHVVGAHLVGNGQLIRHRLEGVGIVRDQELRAHDLGHRPDPGLQGLGILRLELIDG